MSWDRDKGRKAGKAMTIGGSVFGTVFAVFWCIAAASMGAWFMLIFGIPFVGMMIYQLYVCLQLAKEDGNKASSRETDPWERPPVPAAPPQKSADGSEKFCPYCGCTLQEGFEFCPKCGRRQP